jgi:hypothetical protein
MHGFAANGVIKTVHIVWLAKATMINDDAEPLFDALQSSG